MSIAGSHLDFAIDRFDVELRETQALRADDTARPEIEAQSVRGALQYVTVETAVRERCAIVRA